MQIKSNIFNLIKIIFISYFAAFFGVLTANTNYIKPFVNSFTSRGKYKSPSQIDKLDLYWAKQRFKFVQQGW